MLGQFVYIEIPADDTATAREFWGSLLARPEWNWPGIRPPTSPTSITT
jgi:hypothetical protein